MTPEQLQEQWIIFWWAFSISLFAVAIAWKQRFFQSLQPYEPPLIRGKDVLRGFGYFLMVQFFIIPALAALLVVFKTFVFHQAFTLDQQTKGWLYLLVVLAGLGGVMAAYLQVAPSQRQRLWQQTSGPWYRQMGIGIGTWFFAFPLVLAINQLISLFLWHFFSSPFIEQTAVEHLRMMKGDPFVFNLMGFFIFTAVPLTEEMLFRGFLQQWLKQKFGYPWPAILLSSLVFALFHYSQKQGIGNIGLLTSLFFLSCLLGYLYERQRSLWPCIALHGFFNFMTLLFVISK